MRLGRPTIPPSTSMPSLLAAATLASWCVLTIMASPSHAQEPTSASLGPATRPAVRDVLTAEQQRLVERAIDRALAWLATQQQANGAFPTTDRSRDIGQPGVTSLVVLAFLSRGHLPGQGLYGQQINRAIEYVLSCQQDDGLIAAQHPMQVNNLWVNEAATYNHAISGLMLSEAYGMTAGRTNQQIRATLNKALQFALKKQPQPKRHPDDQGGWRYTRLWQNSDSDLSVTSWYLMFLRSCRNAGFDVPSQSIDEALAYVKRCFDPERHFFWYALRGEEHVWTRAMVGAGILALSLGGQHESQMAQQAGNWLLRHPFDQYRVWVGNPDRFFYGAFYCSHAAFQLGGKHWKEFYPVLCRTLVSNQRPDGSWDPEIWLDDMYGNAYSTALAVLALSPPYQLLPIFQR